MKLQKTKKALIILLTIYISFTAGLMYKKSPLYDDRKLIIDMVMKYPTIFKMSNERRAQIIKQSKKCANLKKTNFKKYNLADTLAASKEACLNKTIAKISTAMEYSQNMDSLKGHLVIHIGNLSNSFNAEYIGINELSQKESITYTKNIRTIIEAIPENIPTKEVLIKFTLHNVRFFDDYAKIEFVEDTQIEKLNYKEIDYKGQF